MTTVWLRDDGWWHAMRCSWPGGRITFECALAIDYRAALTGTDPPADARCPACDRELQRHGVDDRFDRSEQTEPHTLTIHDRLEFEDSVVVRISDLDGESE